MKYNNITLDAIERDLDKAIMKSIYIIINYGKLLKKIKFQKNYKFKKKL